MGKYSQMMVQTTNIRISIGCFTVSKVSNSAPNLTIMSIYIFYGHAVSPQIAKTFNLSIFKGCNGLIEQHHH